MAVKSRKVARSKTARRYVKTRRSGAKKACQNMGLPEIRRGLQYIESYAQMALKKTDDMRAAAADFAREWYAVFNKRLELADAEEYLKHATEFEAPSAKAKGKQHGGVAPVDYQLRAGELPPYGTFLPYVSNGFGISIPEMSSTSLCAAGGTPAVMPYPDTGSNRMLGGSGAAASSAAGASSSVGSKSKKQRGAGFMDTLRQIVAHPAPSNPTSVMTDAITAYRGQPLPPGGASTVRAWNYMSGDMTGLKNVLTNAQSANLGSTAAGSSTPAGVPT
jgi:hypothetical protein